MSIVYVDEYARASHLEELLDAEKTRADDLSRTVAAMGEVLRDLHEKAVENHDPRTRITIDAILSRPDVTAERGRWVSKSEHDESRLALCEIAELVGPGGDDTPFGRVESMLSDLTGERDDAITERDAAIARAEKAEADLRKADADRATAWDDARAAEHARDEVGIQLAALQAEHARLLVCFDVVKALDEWAKVRNFTNADDGLLGLVVQLARRSRAALDAVPGDVLDTTGARWFCPDGDPER